MNQREPVPGEVYDAALRYCIRESGEADAALLSRWAEARYPAKRPKDPAAQAFWALSVACNYGVARVVRD